jgi:hypothetical protein
LKDNREASDPVESNHQYQLSICLDNLLIGYVLELARSIDELLPDPVGKLDCREEVAHTEAKAHRDLERSAVIVA